MNRREQTAAPLPLVDGDLEHARAPASSDFGKVPVREIECLGVGGMHFHERFRRMRAEPRAQPRARHGVPLVAHPAGIKTKRKLLACWYACCRGLGRDEARPMVGRIETSIHE